MADASFLAFVLEQLAGARPLKVRPMFGGRAAQLRAPVQGRSESFGGHAWMHAPGRERSWIRSAASTGRYARVAGAQRGRRRPASQCDRHA